MRQWNYIIDLKKPKAAEQAPRIARYIRNVVCPMHQVGGDFTILRLLMTRYFKLNLPLLGEVLSRNDKEG